MIRIPTHRAPTHPGEMLLEEFLNPMGITQRQLADAIHVPYQRVNEIINGRRGVTPATALRLAKGDSKSWSPIDSIILAHAPSLQTELEQRAELSEISEGIAELDLDLKLSLELYYLEGWSVKRISGFTSLPESTIKWRLHTGRRLLRLKLSHMMEDRK